MAGHISYTSTALDDLSGSLKLSMFPFKYGSYSSPSSSKIKSEESSNNSSFSLLKGSSDFGYSKVSVSLLSTIVSSDKASCSSKTTSPVSPSDWGSSETTSDSLLLSFVNS